MHHPKGCSLHVRAAKQFQCMEAGSFLIASKAGVSRGDREQKPSDPGFSLTAVILSCLASVAWQPGSGPAAYN